MTEKQSILGRIAELNGLDVSALLAATQDPGVMLDQLVRDLTATISETEEAISVSEANQRLAELDRDEDRANATRWASAAQSAWDRGDELRTTLGNSNPTPFDELAEAARSKQYAAEGAVGAVDSLIGAQAQAIASLTSGLEQLRGSLRDLKANRTDLIAAASAVPGAVAAASINVFDPASAFALYEATLQQLEARSFGEPTPHDAATDIAEHLSTEPEAEISHVGTDADDDASDSTFRIVGDGGEAVFRDFDEDAADNAVDEFAEEGAEVAEAIADGVDARQVGDWGDRTPDLDDED